MNPCKAAHGIALLLALSGCALFGPDSRALSRASTGDLPPDASVVVGSVAQPDLTFTVHTAHFRFRSVGGGDAFRVSSATTYSTDRVSRADPGLEVENGALFALRLPPGEYVLEWAELMLASMVDVEFDAGPRFRLDPGEIVYIGNLRVTPCYNGYVNAAGIEISQLQVGGVPSVEDRHSRDEGLLRAAYPDLASRDIVNRTLDGSGLREQGRKLYRRCTREIY